MKAKSFGVVAALTTMLFSPSSGNATTYDYISSPLITTVCYTIPAGDCEPGPDYLIAFLTFDFDTSHTSGTFSDSGPSYVPGQFTFATDNYSEGTGGKSCFLQASR